jgi:hypothetical protein
MSERWVAEWMESRIGCMVVVVEVVGSKALATCSSFYALSHFNAFHLIHLLSQETTSIT